MSSPTGKPTAGKLLTLGAKFVVRETAVAITAAGQPVIGPDPLRVWLYFALNSGGLTALSTNPAAASGQGFWLATQGSFFDLWFARHGALAQLAWYVSELPGPGNLTVIEIDYNEEW
jgi:hypothetical protein